MRAWMPITRVLGRGGTQAEAGLCADVFLRGNGAPRRTQARSINHTKLAGINERHGGPWAAKNPGGKRNESRALARPRSAGDSDEEAIVHQRLSGEVLAAPLLANEDEHPVNEDGQKRSEDGVSRVELDH